MNVILVQQVNGGRQIRWGAALLLSCVLGCFTGAVAGAVYFALAGEMSWTAAMIGFAGPLIVVGTGIRRAMAVPFQLPPPA